MMRHFLVVCLLAAMPVFAAEVTTSEVQSWLDSWSEEPELVADQVVYSPLLDDESRAQVQTRSQQQYGEVFRSDRSLEVIDLRQQDGLLAVIVQVTSSSSPSYFLVTSLCFCEREDGWKLAPTMGQYLYSGYKPYDADAAVLRDELESWLYDRGETLGARVEREYFEAVRGKIASAWQGLVEEMDEQVREDQAKQREWTGERFVRAVRERDLYAVAALYGLDQLPLGNVDQYYLGRRDWRDVLYSIEVAVSLEGEELATTWWRKVMAEDAFYVTLPEVGDKEEALCSLGTFHSEGNGAFELIEIHLRELGDRYRIYPNFYMMPLSNREMRRYEYNVRRLSEENRERIDALPEMIIEALRAERLEVATLDALQAELDQSVSAGMMKRWLQLVAWPEGEVSKMEGLMELYVKQFGQFQELMQSDVAGLWRREVSDDGQLARLVYWGYAAGNYQHLQAMALVARRDERGWHLRVDRVAGDGMEELKWHVVAPSVWQQLWRERMAPARVLGTGNGGGWQADDVDQVERASEQYVAALASGELERAMALVAARDEHFEALAAALQGDLQVMQHLGGKMVVRQVLLPDDASARLGAVVIRLRMAGAVGVEELLYPVVCDVDDAASEKQICLLPQYALRRPMRVGDRLLNALAADAFAFQPDLQREWVVLQQRFEQWCEQQ